jgi:hypothetical protein
MTAKTTENTTAAATGVAARLTGGKEIASGVSAAVTAGGRAYVNGILELSRALGGFGRELTVEAGRHVRSTFEARNLRELAELQAAWAQHRMETSTAQTKEFIDLAHAKTMGVITPFAALLKQNKAA